MSKRLVELDSLRGLAALAVVCFHFSEVTSLFPFFLPFSTAVDLFFMISGFVIFLSIDKTASWKEFVFKRFQRLYPTYWICVTITTIAIICNGFYLATSYKLPFRYIVNLTMLQHFVKVTDIDGPYWTLAIELVFYIIIAFYKKFNAIPKLETHGHMFLALPLILVFGVKPFSQKIYDLIYVVLPLINHWPLFFAGILFYKIFKEPAVTKRYISLTLCFVVAIAISQTSSKSGLSFGGYACWLGIYFVLMLLLVKHKLGFLSLKPLLFLGHISYAYYLIHQYIGLNYIIRSFGSGNWTGILLAFAVSITLAWLITYVLEPPFRKWITDKINWGRARYGRRTGQRWSSPNSNFIG